MKAAGRHYAERSYRSWLDAAYTYGRNDVILARDRSQRLLLSAIHQEFQDRHIMVRSLVRLCRGRFWLASFAVSALKLTADAATFVHADGMERSAYSGLFNLRYYSGLFDELDDSQFLFRGVADPV